MLPFAILKELKHCKAVLYSIVDYQVLEQIRVGGQDQERAQQPTITQVTLLHITRGGSILYHHWFIWCDFLGSTPLNQGHVLIIVRDISGVLIQGLISCREL